MATTINADNGVSSGSAGLKESADSSGVLELQTNGTTAVSISTGQVVTLTNALPVASGGTGATTNAGAAFALKGANSDITSLSGLTTPLSVSQGGTGLTTATGVLVGAGPTVSAVAAGTSGNVLTSDGTTWVSQAASGGGTPVTTIYTSPATWSKPASIKEVKVTVFSGGGGGAGSRTRPSSGQPQAGGGGGGAGGFGFFPAASIPGPVSVTVGTAGAGGTVPGTPATVTAGTPGGSSSFGAFITATGGAAAPGAGNGNPTPGGAAGSFTPSPTNIGRPGFAGAAGSTTVSGTGGNSFQLWGIGGPGSGTNSTPGTAGSGYGAGGGGGCTNSPSGGTASGGAGTAGYVIVEEFY